MSSQQEYSQITTKRTTDIKTECKDCFFYQSHKCILNKLEKFKAGQITYDPNEYPTINAMCRFKRANGWKHENKNIEDQIIEVNKENKISTTFIMLTDKVEELSLFKRITGELCLENISLYFVLLNDTLSVKQSLDYQSEYSKISSVFTDNIEEAIDTIVKNITTQYYTVWTLPSAVNLDTFYLLDNLVNNELKKTVCVKSEDLMNGSMYHVRVHNIYSGNTNLSLVEKIRIAAEDQYNREALCII